MNSDSSRRCGLVHINTILPGFVVGIIESYPPYKRLGEALDKIGSEDFDNLPIEDKLDIAAIFQEKSICSSFEAAFVTMHKVKVNFENKPPEYFRMVRENSEKINQFNRQQELNYSLRQK